MSEGHGPQIGWLRAIATSLAIVIVGIGLAVYASNLMLTKLGGLSRSGRVGLATTWFFVVLGGLAATLRWLQRRRLI